MLIVPPGGFAGLAQQTQSTRTRWGQGGGGRATTGRRRRKKSSSRVRAKRATRAKRGGRKMKFGSPAWQKKYKVGKFAKKKRG